ncbi:MAG: type II CRISPR-associated endonuclease Cas1 [Bacilli bacterium]|nr:type II CRISPR-associated endonuclease Cas1 [Bacilli bacterium]
MGFRTVVIDSKSKIELSLNYLVIRSEEEKRIHISEISILVIMSTAVSMTAAALCELNKQKVRIIFCDEKYQPYGELMPYTQGFRNSKRIKEQIFWDGQMSEEIWKCIVKEKIMNQYALLVKRGFKDDSKLLLDYANEVLPGDKTNREGQAAKVYFNRVFGPNFRRGDELNFYNKCLNYGYSIILSSMNREINILGYLTQLGVCHCNEYNPYNLGCDLMEPYRPFVDELVINIKKDSIHWKHCVSDILNKHVKIDEKNTTVGTSIPIYVKSCTDSLTENINMVKFPSEYEL